MGNSFSTTLASAPTTYCTLSYAKTFMGLSGTTYDAKLASLLSAATAAVDNYVQRDSLASASYSEILDGTGRPYPVTVLRLRNYPVTAVSRVALLALALTVGNTDSTLARATAQTTDTELVLTRVSAGTTATDTLAFADYAAVADLATAASALGHGWTATADPTYGGLPATDLKPLQGPFDCRAYAAALGAYAHDIPCPEVDRETGLIRGSLPHGFRNVRVDYTAGYSTIPQDVQLATAMVAKALFDASKLDANLAKERIGDYSYQRADVTTGKAAEFVDARAILDNYRRIGVF